MRLFIQFAPSFLNLPIYAAEKLEQNGFQYTGGIYYGIQRFYDQLHSFSICRDKPLLNVDKEELEWASTPLDHQELERIRRQYGDDKLHMLVLGDRHIGHGNTSGACIVPTPLTKAISKGGSASISQYVVSLVKAVEELLDECAPDLVFQHAIAGAVALALNMVAEHRGIRTLSMFHSRLGSRYFLANLNELSNTIAQKVELNEQVSDGSLTFAKKFLANSRKLQNKPEYSIRSRAKSQKKNSWKSIIRATAKTANGLVSRKNDTPHSSRFHNGLDEMRRPFSFRNQRRILKSLMTPVDLNNGEAFAFFPLQVEPEASTLVYAPDHLDQIHTAFELSHSLPFGMRAYIKEHVPMVGLRPPGFYKRLAKLPNVILLDPWIDSQELISKSTILLTATGTAAFESAMLGIPSVMLGNNFYANMKQGITLRKDHASLRDTIATALNKEPASDEYLCRFIATLYESSFPCDSSVIWTRLAHSDCQETRESGQELADQLIARKNS